MNESLPKTQNVNNAAPGPEDTRSFNSFVNMLEDGILHSELSDALRELNAGMNDHVHKTGNKAKAKMTIEIDFTLDKGVFDIVADYKIKLPKVKRARSVAWSTQGNNFTPQNPRQMQLFGVRDVTSNADIRSV